jgi:pimeloyl-ACP methyl ester carboxylesterase
VTTFVLIPGAGGNASYWRELVAQLEARGHEAIPVDIAQDDPALGLPEYADLVVSAIGQRPDVVVVAQSLGGFTAPMVAERHPVRMIVLLNAMIPLPGERTGEWWDATGSGAARRAADEAADRDPEFDMERVFFHDLPDDVRAQMLEDPPPREPADTIWDQPCDIERWPEVTTRVIAGRDDRLFPLEFQQRLSRDRLAIEPDVLPGGHLLAKSRAAELADQLEAYLG